MIKISGCSCMALCAAAVMLGGCGGLQMWGVPGLVHPDAAITYPAHGRSWMLAEAKNQDLLYVANDGDGDVTVYAYPQGKLVGTLTGFKHPYALCVDHVGNVYVANSFAETLVEYAHGGSSPIKTLIDDGVPTGCAIDRITGDLAATNNCDGPPGSCFPSGTVLIYRRAKGSPRVFTDEYTNEMLYCTYDKGGNLFVNGINGAYEIGFAELPKGGKSFAQIRLKLPGKPFGPGGLQWDGPYLAVARDDGNAIYQYALNHRSAKLVHTTRLRGVLNNYGTNLFRIEGSTVVAPVLGTYEHPYGTVEYFPYPSGGKPNKTIVTSVYYPFAAVVSRGKG